MSKGLSITIVFGAYGGVHLTRTKAFWRVALGWVAIAVYFSDIEDVMQRLMKRR